MLRLLMLLVALCLISTTEARQVRWGNEQADTTAVTELLKSVRAATRSDNPADYMTEIGRRFIGTPYGAGTLEGPVEILTARLDSLDCTTFVETVAALARTAASGRASWQDFLDNLEAIRYRRGTVNGYASRLHYISDWIVENSAAGIVEEATHRMPGCTYNVKTLDYMSRHRDAYPALASDDAAFAAIKNVENGYRRHRFPMIKKSQLAADKKISEALRDGDIVAFTTDIDGLDVSHMGIVCMVDGTPRLLHASSAGGRVMLTDEPLSLYAKRGRRITGIHVIRLTR